MARSTPAQKPRGPASRMFRRRLSCMYGRLLGGGGRQTSRRSGYAQRGEMVMRVRHVPAVAAAALAAALLPAACGGRDSGRTVLPTACPRPGILADGADLTRWQPGPVRDLTTLVFDARLTGLNGNCRPGRGDRTLEVALTPSFSVERGPAAGGVRVAELPWFVAVVGP